MGKYAKDILLLLAGPVIAYLFFLSGAGEKERADEAWHVFIATVILCLAIMTGGISLVVRKKASSFSRYLLTSVFFSIFLSVCILTLWVFIENDAEGKMWLPIVLLFMLMGELPIVVLVPCGIYRILQLSNNQKQQERRATEKNMTRKLGLIILAIISVASIFYLVASRLVNDQLTLTNARDIQLKDIQVIAAEEVIWSGTLGPGGVKTISFIPKKDGSFLLKGKLDGGKKLREEPMGYVTPHAGQHHRISIMQNGDIEYELLGAFGIKDLYQDSMELVENKDVHRAKEELSESIIACVALVDVISIRKKDLFTLEHPSMARESRIATVQPIKSVAGHCNQYHASLPFQLFYDPYSIQLAAGRYLLFLDASDHWIQLKPVTEDERVMIDTGLPPQPIDIAASELIGKAATSLWK